MKTDEATTAPVDAVVHRLRQWIACDQGQSTPENVTDLGRFVQVLMRDDGIMFRIQGKMTDGRRMTKFVEIVADEPFLDQLCAALGAWNADAGF